MKRLLRLRRAIDGWMPSSLTTRLALAYGLTTAAILVGVATYLSSALGSQLQSRDETELVGEVLLVRHLLREVADETEIRTDTHRFADIAMGHEGLILVVRTREGEPLIALNPHNEPIPPLRVLPANTAPDKSLLQTWHPRNGVPSRGMAALGQVGESGRTVEIIVLSDAGYRAALMREYRGELLGAVLCGAIVAAALGYLLARRGLRMLRRMASDAAAVTTSRLATRLDVGGAPEELRELAGALNAMLARLQDSFTRLSQFSADLAHDFRTPISNLVGQTQVTLAQRRTPAEYEALLESNLEEYERLARMIENMLFLARADNAQVAMKRVTLDLGAELARQADYFELLADARGIAIEVAASGTLEADATLFRRALGNLLSNAVQYSPEAAVITLRSWREQDRVVIEVANPGPGIAAEHLPRLFDRFFRGDPARANSGESSGIGLAIVKTIMDLHHGSVQVESVVDGLTAFRLVFPDAPTGPRTPAAA